MLSTLTSAKRELTEQLAIIRHSAHTLWAAAIGEETTQEMIVNRCVEILLAVSTLEE